MTAVRTQEFNCPSCGKQGKATVYGSVNVSMYPAHKAMLWSGEFLSWTCEYCRHTAQLTYPILYHDMSTKVMIQLFPYPERFTVGEMERELGSFPGTSTGLMKDYRFRIVSSFHDLIEKATIFSCGLDDRPVELFKKELVEASVAGQDPEAIRALSDPADQPRLLRVNGEGPDRTMEFAYPALRKLPGGEVFAIAAPRLQTPIAEYEKAVEALKAMPMPTPIFGPFLLIDRDHLSDGVSQDVNASAPPFAGPSSGPQAAGRSKRRPWWKF